MTRPTPFQRVAVMNTAFGNPRGNPDDIDWSRIRAQCKNIFDEYLELLQGLGTCPSILADLQLAHELAFFYGDSYPNEPNPIQVRDALCDIQVFDMGAQHLMGAHGDDDMDDVVDGVMTRFIKDEADKQATIAKHAAKGVTEVYFEGEFPRMVMKSAKDQPDAPKGKFLKSASYRDTVFRPMPGSKECLAELGAEIRLIASNASKNMGHA